MLYREVIIPQIIFLEVRMPFLRHFLLKNIMDNNIKIKNILTVICIIALLLAILSIWPYGYYQILRWLVSGTAIFILYTILELKKRTWTWIMAIIAILFNPIIPIHLAKETWVIIDFIAATLFLISIFKIKKNNI